MTEISQNAGLSTSSPAGLIDANATFQKMKDLLMAKDDTSRFVGLALLKSVLDNEQQFVKNSKLLQSLWESISPKFLDRLLRAQVNGKVEKSQAKDMVDLAVAVLHTFSILLPDSSRKDPRLIERTEPLIKALLQSSPETTPLILQTLLTIVSQSEGALRLLKVDDLSPMTEIAAQNPLVLEILNFTWANASTMISEVQVVKASINELIPKLLLVFKGTDAVTFLSFIANLFPKIPPEARPGSPKWLTSLLLLLRNLVTSRPTAAGRAAYTQAAAALLQAYPETCPLLLFKDDTSKNSDSKPFSYLFINLLLIDLRSSFPSLLAKLNSSDYSSIAQRLAAAFDIISSFIGFLVRSLDDESASFSMPPDLLLKLRKDIAETMSLSIEYMRDRWDASIAGAAGLHPSARPGTAATSEGTRLTLTWDSMTDKVTADPLILSSIQALAIWIREDTNENLRKESAGMMDMFMELYRMSSEQETDFRYPILLALEGIMSLEDGVESFLNHDGWQIVSEDLTTILKNTERCTPFTERFVISESARGLQIITILFAVVENDAPWRMENPPVIVKEEWMNIVAAAARMSIPESSMPPIVFELRLGMMQLCATLARLAGVGMRKRFEGQFKEIKGLVGPLRKRIRELGDREEAEVLGGILDGLVA
ncbi:Duf1941 family protein [Rutstroemia sp. NJR-2017a WRK4]|nr:Duf1941 family protein [Rutstroemia sp. NJR-2017a WRK4]